MVLRVKGAKILDEHGAVVKTLNCPLNISLKDLDHTSRKSIHCSNCDRPILNTKYVSEIELLDLLKNSPETCLLVHKYNPMFDFKEE